MVPRCSHGPAVMRHGELHRLIRRLRRADWRGLRDALLDRIAPARPAMRAMALAAAAERIGLEIGGPSRVFARRGMLPVYACAARIDNVNFAPATTWEETVGEGGEFRTSANRAPGTQFVREAVALTGLADGAYDFVLSSHCLEHVANPLAALREWRRVTRAGGHLILVLPDPPRTFDHRRPVTTLAHLREDEARGVREDDPTHMPEVLALHDLSRDAGVGSAKDLRQRIEQNAANRCLHHHVFDLALMSDVLRESGWNVRATESARPLHLLALARKETG